MYSPDVSQRVSLPSNFRALVNRTEMETFKLLAITVKLMDLTVRQSIPVRAGIFKPIANVSVANNVLSKPSPNKISMVSFKIGNKPP